ncbi:GNAT family N-acetyltransferase [Ruminococcus albus]|uniref:Acetyltransferase, GNAT family n=1 Tax=Ruminococcus albus 8 TaxID=246199 RepID=E9SCQ9_RUMAL|nr:GNAT family N-acetyltransferase [Ruminococcus albus]EGC02910.1 acetyltransferase, GNAT family [Ruminococcus albus 8]MCC3352429.1 GNAT family N-acetyltransferase [Ruminococcus albus 8]
MYNVILREMTKYDIEKCTQIGFSAFGTSAVMQSLYHYESYFKGFIESRERYAFCIETNGKTAGFMTVQEIPSLMGGITIYIDDIAVEKKCQRKGIGTAAIKQLFAMFPDENVNFMLKTMPDIPAYKLYDRLGFMDMNMSVMEKSLITQYIKKLRMENESLKKELEET